MAPLNGHLADEVESTFGRRRGSSISILNNRKYSFFLSFILLPHTIILFHLLLSLLALSPNTIVHILSASPPLNTKVSIPPKPHHPTCPTPTTDLNPAPVPPESGPSRPPAQPPRPTLLAMDRDRPRTTSPTPKLVRLGDDITDPIALIPIIAVPLSVHLVSHARNPRRKPDMILEVIFLPITLPTTKRVHLVTMARFRR